MVTMIEIPNVDPIPLPAPMWLFKGLSLLTLALHFVSVYLLLGGLLVAAFLSFRGQNRTDPLSSLRLTAAAALAKRLPVVMTYVINLGVPPLLFAQVMYGQALYTSSVLIGFYWLAVVGLLIGCYWLIYKGAEQAEAGKAAWLACLGAWLLAASIGKIYVTNMTLMLRPEVWQTMYQTTAMGTHLPPSDPTMMPRWLFMLLGGFTGTGFWMVWLAGRKVFENGVKDYLAAVGGKLAMAGVVLQAACAWWVIQAQPAAVKTALAGLAQAKLAGGALALVGVLLLALGAWASFKRVQGGLAGWLGAVGALVAMLCWVTFRDALRDATLGRHGFDVWSRQVNANWGVVIAFLVLFVIGLGVIGWLISVVLRAKSVQEKVA